MQSGLKNSFAQDLPELSKKCIPSGFQNSEIILKNYDFDDSGTLRVDEFQHDLIKPRLLKDLKNSGSEIYSVQDIFNIFQNFY